MTTNIDDIKRVLLKINKELLEELLEEAEQVEDEKELNFDDG